MVVNHDAGMAAGEYSLRAVATAAGVAAVHVVAGDRAGAVFALHSLHQLLHHHHTAACVTLPGRSPPAPPKPLGAAVVSA